MRHRLRLVSLLTAVTVVLGACGSDPGSTTESSTTSTTPAAYPAEGDVALVRIGRPGDVPRIVIGGDGWVYTAVPDRAAQGISAAAVPPPPPPTAIQRRRLTPHGVAIVLGLADQLGLLATPSTYADPGVTDMDSTEVTVGDGTHTFVHTAYALGFGTETGNRKHLHDFVVATLDLPSLVGATEIGVAEAYVPAQYRVTDAVTFVRGTDEPAWPTGVAVTLGCVSLPADRFPAGVAGIYVADVEGTPSRLAVVPRLPGDDCA